METKKKLAIPFWKTNLNPITGWPTQKVTGKERMGLDVVKMPKIERNRFRG